MDARDQAFLMDFLTSTVWPAVQRSIATAGQTVFPTRGAWNTTYDIPRVWVDGVELTTVAWASASSVTISARTAGQVVIVAVSPGANSGYLPRSGAAAMTGHMAMGGFRVTGMAPSSAASDAVRRDEVIALASAGGDADYLRRDGTNAATGPLDIGGYKLTAVADGTAATDAATVGQVALLDGSQPFTAPVGGVTPTDSAHLATKGYVDGQVSSIGGGVPIGSVFAFAGSTPPTGYQLCYGQAISRTDFAALFAAVGTTYGAGDGSTTFNLPDLRGRFVVGRDDMGGSGAGRVGNYITGYTLGAVGGSEFVTLANGGASTESFSIISGWGGLTYPPFAGYPGPGAADWSKAWRLNKLPPSMVLNWIIKAV